MRLIIDCHDTYFDEALKLALGEMKRVDRYIKPGWGWTFGPHENGKSRFFVRGIKGGISVRGPAEAALHPEPLEQDHG